MDEMDSSDTIITQVYSKGETLLDKTDGILQVRKLYTRKVFTVVFYFQKLKTHYHSLLFC